jgi:hypothetical protein
MKGRAGEGSAERSAAPAARQADLWDDPFADPAPDAIPSIGSVASAAADAAAGAGRSTVDGRARLPKAWALAFLDGMPLVGVSRSVGWALIIPLVPALHFPHLIQGPGPPRPS